MPAIIPINDQYRIELDARSWQISEWIHRQSRVNGGSWESIRWYPTLQQTGEGLVRLLVAQDDLEGVQQILDALHRSSRLIATAIASSNHSNSWEEATTSFEEALCDAL